MQSNSDWRAHRARQHLLNGIAVKQKAIESCLPAILKAVDLIVQTFQTGGKLMLCGNGGSAADCQHVAAEFTNRLTAEFERPGLPALALTTDTSFLTSHANDYGFTTVFARQIEALGKPGDVLLGISTSGNSANVIQAVEVAHTKKIATISLTGQKGRLPEITTVAIAVPTENTQYIQETLLAFEHILCDLVEQTLFAEVAPQ